MKKVSILGCVIALIAPIHVFADEPTTEVVLSEEEGASSSTETEPVHTQAEHVEMVREREVPDETTVEEETHWYENVNALVFGDVYYMVDWNFPEMASATSQAVPHRAYDAASGFNVAFAGLDLNYTGEHVGGTLSLRYGQGADRLLIGTGFLADSNLLKGYFGLKQAFVSWRPVDALMFDFGQFDTPFGAEVSESWLNVNYSRSALYYLMQPFYHTGIRATYTASDMVTIKGLVVNGINNGIDNNLSPWVGGQVVITPSDTFQLYAGYLTGSNGGSLATIVNPYSPDPRSNNNWQQFFDVVANVQLGDLRLIGNADFWLDPDDSLFAGGVSITGQYQICDKLGIGARTDFLFNADEYFGTAYDQLFTATATIDYRPVDNIVIRLEHRYETADASIFPQGNYGTTVTDDMGASSVSSDTRNYWNATTLSVVVHN